MRLAGWLGAMLGLTELQSPECGRTGPTPPPETSPLSHLSHQANTRCEIFSSLISGLWPPPVSDFSFSSKVRAGWVGSKVVVAVVAVVAG